VILVRLLSAAAVVASVAWLIVAPGFEPGLAALASLSTLVSTFLIEKRGVVRQRQSVSQSSIGIQAGGDVKTGPIERSHEK
jgi:hypothetical protein